MERKKKGLSLQSMVIVGLFSAICYIALMLFKIPIPSPVGKPFIHFGNMFVILAALLFSGTIGGLSGSIGMGLFDMLNGWATSAPKTIVLKFGIGFITGLVASKGHKEDVKSPFIGIAIAAAFFIIIGVGLCLASTVYGYEINIPFLQQAAEATEGIKTTLVVIPVLYIFSLILGIGLAVTCFFIKKVSIKLQYAILGAVCGIGFNLVGEFLFAVVSLVIVGSGFMPAVMSALISLPSTIINGTFSIVIAVLLYIPLSKVVAKSNFKF
ncbi:MAG: ECF transporter S component [Niameybacter sp.]